MRSATVRGEGVISVDGREGHSATAGGSQEPTKQQQQKKKRCAFLTVNHKAKDIVCVQYKKFQAQSRSRAKG